MKFEPNRVTVSALELSALVAFTKDEPNYDAIWFDLDGLYAAATDGSSGVSWSAGDKLVRSRAHRRIGVRRAQVPELIAMADRAMRGFSVVIGFDVTSGVDIVESVDEARLLEPIVNAPPPLQVHQWADMNAHLLARLALVQDAEEQGEPCRVYGPADHVSPLRVTCGLHWQVVVMPTRCDKFRTWAPAPKKGKAA